MERILIAGLVALGVALGACNSGGPELQEAAAAEPGARSGLSLPAGEDFGAGVTLDEITSFEDVIGHPENYAHRPVLVRARIYDVCQKRGCWMILREGESEVRVRFKGYDFFVPKDSAGKVAYVEGRVKTELLSEKTAQHYAEESGRQDPSRIDGPRRMVSFVATGVRIVEAEPEGRTAQ